MSGRLSSSSKESHIVTADDRPASGAEPLWRVSDEPVIFVPAPHPVAKCCNRRLPRITQRDAYTPGFSIRLRRAHKATERWGRSREPPAAARFGQVRDGTNSRGRRNTGQSGSPPDAERLGAVITCDLSRTRTSTKPAALVPERGRHLLILLASRSEDSACTILTSQLSCARETRMCH